LYWLWSYSSQNKNLPISFIDGWLESNLRNYFLHSEFIKVFFVFVKFPFNFSSFFLVCSSIWSKLSILPKKEKDLPVMLKWEWFFVNLRFPIKDSFRLNLFHKNKIKNKRWKVFCIKVKWLFHLLINKFSLIKDLFYIKYFNVQLNDLFNTKNPFVDQQC